MVDIEKSFNEIVEFLYGDNSINPNCSNVWYGTIESIRSYFELLNWENVNKVLTVCSSGDHVLNSICYGAKYIDAFDINPLTFPYLQLKNGLILALPYTEYFRFFEKLSLACSSAEFEYELFLKFKDYIPHPYDIFWEKLFLENIRKNSHNSVKPGLLGKMCKNYIPFSTMKLRNRYLSSEEDYEKLRQNLRSCIITFQEADIFNLDKKFDDCYDKIFLSNISDYLDVNYERFNNFIKNILANLLSENGEIIVAYIYSYIANYEKLGIHFKNSWGSSASFFNQDYILEQIPNISDFGYIDPGYKDAVLIYRRKKI